MSASYGDRYLQLRYASGAKGGYPEELASYLAQRHFVGAGTRLLDLGCGRGDYLDAFGALGFRCWGVDRAGGEEPRRVRVDFARSELPFRVASFDLIFSKSVLEHVADPEHLLAECRRVLVPGGRLLLMVPDWRSQWRSFYDDPTHVRPYTLRGLRDCVAMHGFSVLHAERFRQLPALWRSPWLAPLAALATLAPSALDARSKWVRFSKERMLLVVAERPTTTVNQE